MVNLGQITEDSTCHATELAPLLLMFVPCPPLVRKDRWPLPICALGAGLTVSAALSPTAVSSLALFQVPSPHPAAPTMRPRTFPSWGSRAKSFGNLSLMSSVIKVLIWQVGRLTMSPISEVNAVGSFVDLSPPPWALFTFTAGDLAAASEDATGHIMILLRPFPAFVLPVPFWATQGQASNQPVTDHSSSR